MGKIFEFSIWFHSETQLHLRKYSTSLLGLALLSAYLTQPVSAAIYFYNINLSVPDAISGHAGELLNTQTITDSYYIADITVHLKLQGSSALNGDYYAYLEHNGNLAVLLNRSGRSAANNLGYGDPGFDVTFADNAANGDIHQYRSTLFGGNESLALGSALTDVTGPGPWAPDGRNVSPSMSLDTSPRTAFLSQFHGLPVNGEWNLYIADLNSAGSAALQSWSMTITPVPEPVSISAAAVLLMAVRFLLKNIR